MSSARRQYEELVVIGLVQEPKRLADLVGFQASYFSLPETRLLYWCASTYNAKHLASGKVRYASKSVLNRLVQEWEAKAVDKQQRKSRKSSAAAAMLLVEESSTLDYVDNHTYRDAVDKLREMAMDDVGSKGILSIVETLRKSGPAGLAERLRDLASRVSSVGEVANVGQLTAEAPQAIKDYSVAKRSPNSGYIRTPFPELNEACGGGKNGRLWIVAGYAKDGKTQCALELVYNAVFEQCRGAMIVTGEQTKSDIRNAIIVRHSHKFLPGGLRRRHVDNGTLSPEHEGVLSKTVQDISSSKYGPVSYFQAPGGCTIGDVRAIAEATARRHPIDVLLIDHSDLFEPTREQRSDVARLAAVVRECKQLALDFLEGRGVWVLLCHQIKRDGYEAALKRGYYVPSDMAGTAEAERSCDVMLWILRDDAMREVSEARLGVGIDRYGAGIPKGWAVYERYECAALLPIRA